MTNNQPDPKPKQNRNRPTDPFGGPSRRGNTISLSVVIIAFVFFLLIQWTNGNLGGLLNGTEVLPTVAAPSDNPQPTPTIEETAEDETPAAQATATQPPSSTATPVNPGQARGAETPRATTQPTPTANSPPAARASDLPTIAYAELPPEAHETIALIEQGGPFPFSRDGITFENRERILPRQPAGYYREYTVITPGVDHRGARRIVTGDEGEMYYTDDHYESFREILR